MSKHRVQIIILCEDRQQEVFARRFLQKRGFRGRFRSQICLKGSQSGEQYVRKQYPVEVKAYRQNRHRVSIGLVVFIDADADATQHRLQQLSSALLQNQQADRQHDEAIAIFIPKRNIETWIHYLMGEIVNEDEVYRKFAQESDCQSAVEQLAERCNQHQALPTEAPPDLQSACQELERLLVTLMS